MHIFREMIRKDVKSFKIKCNQEILTCSRWMHADCCQNADAPVTLVYRDQRWSSRREQPT